MREHRYTMDLPHRAERMWALFGDYDRWADYAPMVIGVEVLWPGDDHGNGLLRRVIYKMPLGRTGSALELVHDVDPGRAYTFTMIGRRPGTDQTGRVTLEPVDGTSCRLHFEERYHLTSAPWRWFEGPIYRFINRQNEASMRAASEWLTDHPEYRPELIDHE
ncbi:MAG TPA: SRPBCC family protein [Acidimicrobiales bacterium]